MVDDMVKRAQRFVNSVYGSVIGMTVDEDGKTSWNTMYALTRALQFELRIPTLSNNFGPTTLATLTQKYPSLNYGNMPSADFCRIIQSALYCKGYDGSDINGLYSSRVESAMIKMKTDMGVEDLYPGSDLTPKIFKSLLNMDAYVVVNSGSGAIRNIQQWLNGRYTNRQDFFVIPCDGHNSRDVAKSMLFAVQYELGMADGVATGNFGPATQAGLKAHTVSQGSIGTWVSLFRAAMNLNDRPVAFISGYDSLLNDAVQKFQAFVKLPVTGIGDFSTWASLLASYGDQSRKGEACDGVTKITPARAAALKAEGITYVGRYLTNPSTTHLPEKAIQPGELQTIATNGLRCFPIYQTYGRDVAGFNYAAGRGAGYAAINAARDHGFKDGTRIFFAVDLDVLDHEVTSNILPHFKGIQDSMSDAGNPYAIGVYGPRNVCSRVAGAGHSTASFVSDMSSGFSGNYGYPLPADWAYDQIVGRTIGTGEGWIEIDNNIASGRDIGQNSFDPPRGLLPDTRLDASTLVALQDDLGKYMESIGFPNDGGVKTYQHWKCFQTTVVDHDDVITELSNRYNMRKALIQTSAYWEMRHIGLEDEAQDLRVKAYHTGLPGGVRDSSTGIAQITGNAAILAWNHCIGKGYVSGTLRDPDKDSDIYAVWKMVQGEEFALRTVALIHLWGSEGKPGGMNPPGGEYMLRSMRLDYTETETFEVLRRYQGWGDEAVAHAGKRMALYQILEKYNGIARNR
ncbi:glycoside hydrolase domain-containing protein [Embleya sp. NPDC055664]